MPKTIGIITSNYRIGSLMGLTEHRPIAAVPFAGRYRLLDFALSAMVNSGIRTVGIVIPHNYRSILDHLGAGKEWYLDRKVEGLFFLPGSEYGMRLANRKFLLRDFLQNMELFEKENEDQVIISSSHQVYNINYQKALTKHRENKADVTLLYQGKPQVLPEEREQMYLFKNSDGRVTSLVKGKSLGDEEEKNLFLDILMIKKEFLLEILQDGESIEHLDLLEVISNNLALAGIYSYHYTGYYSPIDSVENYFESSMDMLEARYREELFMGPDMIYTKIKDHPPSKYEEGALATNSLVSSGCKIEGQVIDSIIFRGVKICKETRIKNCIIMQKCQIGQGAVLENVILDKFTQVNSGVILKGKKETPIVINKNSIV